MILGERKNTREKEANEANTFFLYTKQIRCISMEYFIHIKKNKCKNCIKQKASNFNKKMIEGEKNGII